MNKNPLVSICTTFFNAERYIYRLIESCLNQTYKNIELVIIDDASTDGSEKIVKKYAARDPRIKYFRNDIRSNIAESFLKMFKSAKGEFAMMMGADDWLPGNYVENGVRIFLKYPDIAGIVPDVTSLFEYENDLFKFRNRGHIRSELRSTEWFIKRMYGTAINLYVSGYALVRSRDAVRAVEYYIKNYYRNQSESLPRELKGFFRRVFGFDSMFFTEILTQYKNFIFDGSLNYIKIENSENQRFDLEWNSLAEIFKGAYYYLLIYTYVYKLEWPKFYRGMKIFRGTQVLSAAFIYFFRCNMRFSFLNFSESKEYIRGFFSDFSFFEIVVTVIYSIPMIVWRCLIFVGKKLFGKEKHNVLKNSIFTQENFLSPEGRFKVN